MDGIKWAAFLVLGIFFLGGCTSHNIPIAIPGLSVKSDSRVKFKTISVYDLTDLDSDREYSFFDVWRAPLKEAPPFARIVSDDISAFFSRSGESQYGLKVQIHHAQPYRTVTGLQRIPVLSLFAPAGKTTEYGVYMRILFEVLRDGKVIKTYTYYDTIKTVTQNDAGNDLEKAYKKLVAAYRQEFFQQLDREFVAKYF